jgi:hypothetical protein
MIESNMDINGGLNYKEFCKMMHRLSDKRLYKSKEDGSKKKSVI